MVAFKRMWEDVNSLVKKGSFSGVRNIKTYVGGFIIKNEEEAMFLDSQDFIDFWSEMLIYKELDISSMQNNKNHNFSLIYKLVRELPYIEERKGKLTLVSSVVEKH